MLSYKRRSRTQGKQQNSFDQAKEGNIKKETNQDRREEEEDNNTSAQAKVCRIELGAGFAGIKIL